MLIQVNTPRAPAAIGPFSQAIRVGNLLFVSGQLPIDAETGKFTSDDPVEQAGQCLRNIAAIAEASRTDLTKTVKATVMLTDLSHFPAINAVYRTFFSEPYPARVCYQVAALPMGAQVEIDAVISIT